MRPGDFSPGNRHVAGHGLVLVCDASMRPGDFSPGNMSGAGGWRRCTARFNEAGGFLPRKPPRPSTPPSPTRRGRFNEAGGFLPRKPPRCREAARSIRPRFNEAGGVLPRKHEAEVCDSAEVYGASMRPGDFSPGNLDGFKEADA